MTPATDLFRIRHVGVPPGPRLAGPLAMRKPQADTLTSPLALVFVLVYTQGFISERVFGVSRATGADAESVLSRLAVELAVALALAVLFMRRPIASPPGLRWFVCYIAACLIAGYFSTDSLADAFLYCRYTLYALAIYAVGCNVRPGQPGMPCERLLAALFALQLLASVFKTFVFGDRTEWRVGTMLISGGSTATIFPLLALGFTMGYYFFYVRRSLWVLLAGLSFGLIGYASGKRTILLALPIFVCLNMLLYWIVNRRAARLGLSSLISHLLVCLCIGAPVLALGLARSHGVALNSDKASTQERFQHALKFAEEYETNTRSGNVSGRFSAGRRVLEATSARPVAEILHGWGPAALLPKRHLIPRDVTGFKPYGIQYGITGWSRDLISSGVFATLFLVLAYGAAMRNTYSILVSTCLEPRLKAVAFGTFSGFVVFFYAYFLYTFAPLTNGTITFVLLFCAGFLHSIARKQSSSPSAGLHTLRPRPSICAS